MYGTSIRMPNQRKRSQEMFAIARYNNVSCYIGRNCAKHVMRDVVSWAALTHENDKQYCCQLIHCLATTNAYRIEIVFMSVLTTPG